MQVEGQSFNVAAEVERRLDEKDSQVLRTQKMRKGQTGEGLRAPEQENAKYLDKHDVISKQIKRINPETAFPFESPLWCQRLTFLATLVDKFQVKTIIDYGCGSGKFIHYIKTSQEQDREIFGIDIDKFQLEAAVNHCSPLASDYIKQRTKNFIVHLIHGSVLEPTEDLRNKDCLVCSEVMEHMIRPEVDELGNVVFGYLRPKVAVFTTPNHDFNVVFNSLQSGLFRHWNHKFEMSRRQFQQWANSLGLQYNYKVRFSGVGKQPSEFKNDIGYCTQIAIFERLENTEPQYIPKRQQLTSLKTIIFPVSDPHNLEQLMKDLESNIDYYYRLHCNNSVKDEYEDPQYNIWVPISTIFSYKCDVFETVKDISTIQRVIQQSQLFELSDNGINIRGTPYYVTLNDPMAEMDDDYF